MGGEGRFGGFFGGAFSSLFLLKYIYFFFWGGHWGGSIPTHKEAMQGGWLGFWAVWGWNARKLGGGLEVRALN